jgi:cell division protease FtsH
MSSLLPLTPVAAATTARHQTTHALLGEESSSREEILRLLSSGDVTHASFIAEESVVILISRGGSARKISYDPSLGPELVLSMLQEGVDVSITTDPATTDPATSAPVESPPAPTAAAETEGGSLLGSVGPYVPAVMFLGFVVYVIRSRRPRGGRKQDDPAPTTGPPTVTFADVAGCNEAVEDLREIVEFLRDPAKFERLGAKVPRGALLVGPPGTGKTLLAKAVAGEADVAFFDASGSDFVELYVGMGAKRVRELFSEANQAGKAIIFIDEIDAIGRARSGSPEASSGANLEQENTLLALLNELDGFKPTGVVVLAATNRPDILDPALTRPGRLERRIHVPNPDRLARERILKVHTANKPLGDDVDLALIARRTPGVSGADIAHIANEAALHAARHGLHSVSQVCFEEAVATVIMGRARHSAMVTPRDREITAWHEAGHALAALLEPHAEDPVAVSIVPRGPAGGVTWMSGSDDQFLSRESAMARLVVALSGRVGEEILLNGEFTHGAQSDLVSATELAVRMVTKFGMTRRGLQVREFAYGSVDDESADVVDEVLAEALERSRTILTANIASMHALVSALLEFGTIGAADIAEIMKGRPVPARQRPAHVKQLGVPAPCAPSDADASADAIGKVKRKCRRLRRRSQPRHA